MELSFNVTLPGLLAGKVKVSTPYQNYNANGRPSSFGVDLNFPEIKQQKTLKSSDFNLLPGKIEDTLRNWEIKYQRHLDLKHRERREGSVDDMNREAKEAINVLDGILKHTLNINDAIDWAVIKRKDAFRTTPQQLFDGSPALDYIKFNDYGRPVEFTPKPTPTKPAYKDIKENAIVNVKTKSKEGVEIIVPCDTGDNTTAIYKQVESEYSFLDRLFKRSAIKADFEQRLKDATDLELKKQLDLWHQQVEQTKQDNATREAKYNEAISVFERKKAAFEEDKLRDNAVLDNIKSRYQNSDPKAVEEYCDLVLNRSVYPDYFPQDWRSEYKVDSRIFVIEYDLPSPDQLPTVESYKYVKTKDEIIEKLIQEGERRKLYDSVIYQICIRTIHELFEADVVNALGTVAFNGLVTRNNIATGISETKVIMSVIVDKNVFMAFDLSQIDPKATFKHLKGVSAATLVDVTPIPPILRLDKTDKRFIEGKDVAYQLDESVNIAAMDWQDFEYLIRELFEKEFASNGGEVKVTQASADGGVDAIAFDPDPIRGGKIVIQAKRYTNTVGVAAVRDLYGTLMNEGATKGILVTTADYGKDSYEFAKDKPLTLLNGSNLLALLEKHGHKARINVSEAKKILYG